MVMVSIHTIMSTTSSCQPRHHVNAIIKQLGSVRVQKRANSRMETLSGAKPCVFSGNVAPGVAEVGSLFPRLRASIWESSRQKVSICILHFNMLKTWGARRSEHFWKMMRSEKCARDCRESSISQKSVKNWGPRSSLKSRPCWRCANVGWFGATLLRFGFATGCDRLRLRAAKHEWCYDAPGKRDCSWRLLNALYSCAKGSSWP